MQRHRLAGIEVRHAHVQRQAVPAFGAGALSELRLQTPADCPRATSAYLDDQGHEFIAAQSGGHVGLTKCFPDARRGARYRPITLAIAKSVVDRFEPIHICEEHQEFPPCTARPSQITSRKRNKSAAV